MHTHTHTHIHNMHNSPVQSLTLQRRGRGRYVTDSICQRREAEPAAPIPRGVIFPVVLINIGDYSDAAIAHILVLFDGIRSSEISYIFGGLQLRWGTCVIKTSDFQDSCFKACVTPKINSDQPNVCLSGQKYVVFRKPRAPEPRLPMSVNKKS